MCLYSYCISTFIFPFVVFLFYTDTGSILVECKTDDLDIVLVAWKGKTSVRAYVPKSDRIHYLRLSGGDVSKFGN